MLHHVDPEWQSTVARIASATEGQGEGCAAVLTDVVTSFGFDEESEIVGDANAHLDSETIRPSGGRAPPA